MGPLDCVQCGACCISYTAVEVSAIDDPQTPQELTKSLEGHPEFDAETIEKRQLRTMATSCLNRCVALQGTVGKPGIACAIYDRRPKVCRTYEKGSPACIQARGVIEFWLFTEERKDRRPDLYEPKEG